MIENNTWYRCTICGQEGIVGRCCGDETRIPINEAAKREQAKLGEEEIYRHLEVENDLYSPSIFILKNNNVGIKVDSSVHIMSLRDWHNCAESFSVKTETTHNSGYMVRIAKAILSQIAKATSYIRKRCVKCFVLK